MHPLHGITRLTDAVQNRSLYNSHASWVDHAYVSGSCMLQSGGASGGGGEGGGGERHSCGPLAVYKGFINRSGACSTARAQVAEMVGLNQVGHVHSLTLFSE